MKEDVGRLLGRGGRILGLAAVAHASSARTGAHRWSVLSEELCLAADQIIGVIEGGVERGAMATAVGAAMGSGPATAAPSWATPVWENPGALSEVGRRVRTRQEIFGAAADADDDRSAGLRALAVSLCRGLDGAMAVAEKLGKVDGEQLVSMSRLAQATVLPGEPSEVRSRVREALGVRNG